MHALALTIAMLCAPAELTVVRDGQPLATAVLAPDAETQTTAAASLLVDYLQQSTGATLPIATAAADGLKLHVGRSAYVDGLGLQLDQLDDDGFVLQGIDAANYVLAGPTPWGTEFAVTEFLERYVGVRWLLPGEHGTDVPQRTTLRVPSAAVRLEPALFSRLLSGLRGEAQSTWARRNRMHGRVSFHHNLLKLFPPSKYFATHPEFYPILNGERYQPTSDTDPRWQPNFSAPGIVDEAVKNICQFFRDNPQATSYSLGINDGRGYDESPESLARESGGKNRLGLRDVSDSYYLWCNQVIEGVLKEFPDKWFGCLAYSNVFDPPQQVKVSPRLIPYMTYDRMRWIDPELREMGHAWQEQWQQMSPVLGWYDYAYGSPYCLPRVYPHQMQRYLTYGRDHGVRAHYAEIYPNWGEGPKPYLFLRLQWNPDLDVEAALDEWYERCVGPAAAPLLKEYYAIWERFWTKDIMTSPWFTKTGQYLAFSSPAYLAIVKEADVYRSRQLLDECLAKAQTADQQARAGLLRTAFDYYEASALAYRGEMVSREQPIDTVDQAVAAVTDAGQRLRMAQRRRDFVKDHVGDPVLDTPLGMDRYGALQGQAWGAGLLWRLVDWVGREPRVKRAVEALLQNDTEIVRQQAQALLAMTSGDLGTRVSENASFEDGIKGWSTWVKWSTGKLTVDTGTAHTGDKSILLEGVKRGGPHVTIQVTPGHYLAVGYCYLPADQNSKGTVTVTATMRGEDGVNLPTPMTELVPSAGRWTPVVCPVTVPAEVNGKPVTNVLLIAYVNGFEPGEKAWIDDLALYRVGD